MQQQQLRDIASSRDDTQPARNGRDVRATVARKKAAVDGAEVDFGETVAYKGMMLCGVPNMVLTLGYTNASWTLKADLVAQYVCRLLKTMDARGAPICTPQAPEAGQPKEPIIDLKSGYVLRSIDALPKQGARPPWRLHQNYLRDIRMLRHGPVDDEMEFASPAPRPREAPLAAVAA